MSKLKLTDVTNVIAEPYSYSTLVDYFRFLDAFGRGKKVIATDPQLLSVLQVDYPSYASIKLSRLFTEGLLDREEGQTNDMGRKPYSYCAPK